VVLLEVGRIAKPHGLKGEVIVELITDRVERVDPGSVLQTDEGPLEILRSSRHQGRWIVAFAGVDDRTGAEALRNRTLKAEALQDPDAWWVHELIGAVVIDRGGRQLGTVATIEANPASDLLVLDSGALIPLRFVVDRLPGQVTVEVPDGLIP
jgi:16S rRNA processing protein RimM